MKPHALLLIIAALLTANFASLAHAQTATTAKPAAAATTTNSTVVTSDQFKLDMPSKQGLFTGNVVVTGSDFKLKSREMQVFFDENNKIKRMIARGNVETEQADRTTKSGQLDYIISENKIILTESPQVIQSRNTVTGNTITIYRDTNRMDVDGRNRMILYENEPSTPAK
jgi:lipopolysaccharide export system protein LptA